MRADDRRQALVAILQSKKQAVTGGALSEALQVSRQIIVQDIAVLKAKGYEIISTHCGYLLTSSPLRERVFKVRHTSEETPKELSAIVELGGSVADVFVWHKVYGKISANLNIFSPHGIEKFMEGIKSGKSSELMHITSGYHYHTVRAESEETLDRIGAKLDEMNFIVPEV